MTPKQATKKKKHWKFVDFNQQIHIAHLILIHCRMYQDKLASLKRQLQHLQEGNHHCILIIGEICQT